MASTLPIVLENEGSETTWPVRLAPRLMELIERIRRTSPTLFGLAEHRLLELLQDANREPNPTASMLRLRFWDEYQRVEGRGMVALNIYRDVCTMDAWETELRDPYSLAWILTPIMSLQVQREELIHSLIRNLAPMMRSSPYKKDGQLDVKVARMQMELLLYLDQKNSGGITQKIEQTNRSLNVHANLTGKVNVDAAEIEKAVQGMTLAEIEQKIREAREGTGTKVLEVKAE